MAITMEELDGKYQVVSETSEGGPYVVNGDGVTEIRDGQTFRKDKNGFIWESAFSIRGDKVEMESTIDPSHADSFIKDEKGNPTKAMVTFRAELEVSRTDGRLTLSGEIRHGGVTTRLKMIRL